MTERIPGEALAIILILPPLYNTLNQITLDAPSHIVCTPYVDAEHWSKDFNDQLYERAARPEPHGHISRSGSRKS